MSSRRPRVARVVVDANILLRAAISPKGISARLHAAARRGDFQLLLSPYIMHETRAAFFKPNVRPRYPIELRQIAAYLAELWQLADFVPGRLEVKYGSTDPKDNPVLACAVEGRADVIVSDDRRHLLPLGAYKRIPIVSVPVFLRKWLPRT